MKFLDSLIPNSFRTYILQQTRNTSHSKTFTDNMFSIFILHEVIFRNITATIFDHLSQILLIATILSKYSSRKTSIYERHSSKFI